MKRQSKKIGFCQGAEKAVEHKGDDDTFCSWCSWNGPEKSEKEIVWRGDHRKSIQTTASLKSTRIKMQPKEFVNCKEFSFKPKIPELDNFIWNIIP